MRALVIFTLVFAMGGQTFAKTAVREGREGAVREAKPFDRMTEEEKRSYLETMTAKEREAFMKREEAKRAAEEASGVNRGRTMGGAARGQRTLTPEERAHIESGKALNRGKGNRYADIDQTIKSLEDVISQVGKSKLKQEDKDAFLADMRAVLEDSKLSADSKEGKMVLAELTLRFLKDKAKLSEEDAIKLAEELANRIANGKEVTMDVLDVIMSVSCPSKCNSGLPISPVCQKVGRFKGAALAAKLTGLALATAWVNYCKADFSKLPSEVVVNTGSTPPTLKISGLNTPVDELKPKKATGTSTN